jgi:ribose/xylose/arabinose/galactoside ABC-type transport system permease subunit
MSFLRSFQRTEWALLFAIVIVVVLTGLLDEQHNYWRNPRASAVDILRQTALLGIFSLGAAVVIIAGGIDLSSGSVIAFSGTVCATLMVLLAPEEMVQGLPLGTGVIVTAIAGTLVAGLLIGSLHAWLITVVGLPPFVATLATLVGLRSFGRALAETVTGPVYRQPKYQIEIFDPDFRYLATSVWVPVVVFVVLTAVLWVLMSRTVVGRHLHALGGNEAATRLSGIPTDRLKWLAYCISAVLSSVAGIIYVAEQAVAAPQVLGRGYELNAIAAAVVGGCSLQGGIGTIPGTVLGALFLRTVIDGVAKIIKTGADVYEGLIVGGVVVVAVALTQLRQAGRRGKRFFAGPLGLVTVLNLAVLAGALAALLGQRVFETLSRQIPALQSIEAPRPLAFAAAGGGLTLVLLLLLRYLEQRHGTSPER